MQHRYNMWHEARKQEKKIRGIMVDYKRRAERRREYYERIKQDPAQFLQLHGRPCRIHLDPAIAQAADSPATMMPWQGHLDNMIDRFDVRAHLDVIPEIVKNIQLPKQTPEDLVEDRQANYECYRTLVQNDYLGVSEDKFLHQIFIEERFGDLGKLRPGEDEKKKLADKKAAIAYVYEDSTPTPSETNKYENDKEEDEEDEEDFSDLDLDVTIDVTQLSTEQCSEMNVQATSYGMIGTDFISYLHQDKDEADELKLARELEEEKAMYSGRKSRRERRALREKKLQGRRVTSPPSYAAKESPPNKPFQRAHSSSRSRSPSPANAGQITFITSFGGEGSEEDTSKRVNTPTPKTGIGSEKATREQTKEVGPQIPERKASPSASTSSSSTSSDSRSSHSSGRRRRSRRRQSSSSSSSSSSSVRSRRRSRWRRHGRRRRSYSRSRGRSSSSSSSSRSRSRSSKSSSESRRSRSRSRTLPTPPIRSYYRHSLSRSSSDSLESSDDSRSDSQHFSQPRKQLPVLGKTSQGTKSKLTPQEKLKRKMQAALNRQYKADKRAELEKIEKQEQERHDRAEELREMAIKLRQRERERRHRLQDAEDDDVEMEDNSEPSPNRSRNHSPPPPLPQPRGSPPEPRRRRESRVSPEPPPRRRRDGHGRRSRTRSRSRDRGRSPRRSEYRESSGRRRSRSRRRNPLVDY